MNSEKDMLNKELAALQKRIVELEREKQLQLEVEIEKEKTEDFPREREKELNCLYSVSELIDQHDSSIENILQGVADLLPPSWQHPHITCSRVIFKDEKYVTSNFQITKWRQVAEIVVGGIKEGTVEVYYLEEMPGIDEGPFLKEERLMINAVAERIGKVLERIRLSHFLQERVKELSCLYGISHLIETHGNDQEKILQGIADLLPSNWQYPKDTCSRIIFEGKEFVSDRFKISPWKQTASINIERQKVGEVDVYYRKELPTIDEGPFLNEERLLINAVAKRISRSIERIRIEQQLEVEHKALEHKNIALREVLDRVQEEKEQMGAGIQSNVDKIIMPILLAFESRLSKEQLEYVKLIKSSLEEIISPFTNKISKEFSRLSSAEIQICNMIKNGFTTKEIARLRGISTATVSRHREHIRTKLGLTNNKINLATFLNNFMSNS